MKREFDLNGLMVSVNVPGYDNIAASGFDAKLANSVDFMSIAAHDYHGSWESVTGLTAPLSNVVRNRNLINLMNNLSAFNIV